MFSNFWLKFSIIFAIIGLTVSQSLRPDLVQIKHHFNCEKCMTKISDQEQYCHVKFLDTFDEISGNTGPKQESDQYKHLVCCNIWRYYDCVSDSVLNECSREDRQSYESFIDSVNDITVYCADYPYRTYRCWRFPLWAVLLCLFSALLLILGTGIGVWFWKRNQITYWRYRRKY